MVLPKPARLIAAIIFIALVASAIHFLATKPSSGALTKTYSNPPGGGDATERIGADPNNSLYFSGTLDDVRLYKRTLRHRNKTNLQRRPVMRPLTAMELLDPRTF